MRAHELKKRKNEREKPHSKLFFFPVSLFKALSCFMKRFTPLVVFLFFFLPFCRLSQSDEQFDEVCKCFLTLKKRKKENVRVFDHFFCFNFSVPSYNPFNILIMPYTLSRSSHIVHCNKLKSPFSGAVEIRRTHLSLYLAKTTTST